jgi:hypothetical protein
MLDEPATISDQFIASGDYEAAIERCGAMTLDTGPAHGDWRHDSAVSARYWECCSATIWMTISP